MRYLVCLSLDLPLPMIFRFSLPLILSLGATTLWAQAPFAETPGSQRADDRYSQAIEDSEQAYLDGREAALAEWLRAYEAALAEAKADGDLESVEYLTDAISRSKAAGFVVWPVPRDASSFGGHSYLLIKEPLPWHVAQRRCEAMGGHLVTIESADESTFVVQTFGKSAFYVGAGDFAKEGFYLWPDGSPFQAFDRRTRFDNGKGTEHAIFWSEGKRRWLDADEGVPLPYLCEWDR